MAGLNGRGPAPVLPAMGLHSFHNDSPPFSGATELPGDQPEPMSLEGSRHSSTNASGSGSNNGMLSPPAADATFLNFHPYQAHPGNGPSVYETARASVRAGGPGAPVSGKNSPPTGQVWEKDLRKSPAALAHRNISQEAVPKTDGQASPSPASKREQILQSEEEIAYDIDGAHQVSAGPLEVEPNADAGSPRQSDMFRRVSTSMDDVTLSAQRSRRLVSGYLFGGPQTSSSSSMKRAPSSEVDTETQRRMSHSEERPTPIIRTSSPSGSAKGPRKSTSPKSVKAPPSRRPTLATHASSASANRFIDDAGMSYEDNLKGVNDGEADADDSAPKAENGGSGAYMRKESGEYGEYMFPTHRLRKSMKDEAKIPLVIVACGSFSPPTYLHLRMFEMAKDELVESQTFEIMAGYYSPVSSYYKKAGLAPAIDRVRMCELAVEHTSTWLMVDPWEAGQPEYQRTAVVLDHFDEMLNGEDGQGGVEMSDGGPRRKYKVMLLAGGDLIESFGEPGVWSEPDLHVILGRFGCLIVERAGSDVWAFLLSHDILYHHRRNVIVIKQLIYNDISSTKVRLFVRRGMSIKYLLPNMVIQYIEQNKLYLEPDNRSATSSS